MNIVMEETAKAYIKARSEQRSITLDLVERPRGL